MMVLKGIITMLSCSVCVLYSATPLTLSMSLVLISVMVGMTLLATKSNSFAMAAMVISFSSGMMVMFCYCVTLLNYEKKKSLNKVAIMLPMATLILSVSGNTSDMVSYSEMSIPASYFFLLVAMATVVLTMVSVNKSMFHPKKTSMVSY